VISSPVARSTKTSRSAPKSREHHELIAAIKDEVASRCRTSSSRPPTATFSAPRELGRPDWRPGSGQLAKAHLEQLLDFVTEPDPVLGVECG
jgi:hypothetical protein